MTSERPPGGHRFEAVRVAPEGWLVLAPWIQNEDGYWYRPHIDARGGHDERTREWAEYIAAAINAAMERGNG